ncbi:hypothetical protein [Streptomyces wuyuanensis]|uniref:Uncharacterized protein n=1 Tax=Streptomyces wuyuanensis TaxID=1196353 RepID=A0A1G9WMH7_9ACTN|nr:hypothetical protein [Streptomyces wuyuanensis]SDM85557.1 hypothetical protein SAMN05444921_11485 [Streptomyces wuyuanensis]
MAAPTNVYTTTDIAAMLANPHCPPQLRANWDRLTTTAAYHAAAVRRRDIPALRVGDDAEDVDYWRAQNDSALGHLSSALARHEAIIPALIAGADPYAFAATR